MTNETLQAHMRAYRSRVINIKDHADMVEELVTRGEREIESKEEVRKRFDDMRDNFIAMLDDE